VNKTDKSSIFKSSLLVALLGAAFGAHAAGLGKLTVYSAIGQPLNAEVALTASQDELSGLSAKLASHSAFTDAGIDFMPALSGVRFNVAKLPNGQAVLRLTTDSPLNEPFLHFLVELNWTAGRMVREYTFLLDPPEMLQVAKPASVVVPVAPPVQAAAKPAPVKAAPLPGLASPPAAASADQSSDAEHRVKSGETLSKIARENKIEAVSLDQMLVALFNNNRDAFVGNNMNRLRAGKILRLPSPAEAAKVDAGEARKLIVSQAADFNAYRRRLADAAGNAAVAESAPQQEATGKIKPQMETKAPPAPAAADKLEISRTETAKTAKAGSGKSSLEEDLIARDKSLREASERIAQLEKNLENLKHLVELKSQPGTQMQQQAQVAAAAKPAEEKKPEPPAAKAAEPAPAATAPVAEKPAEPAAAPDGAAEAAKPVEAAPPPVTPPAPPKPAAKRPLPPPPPPPPPPSFVEDNPELVFGGGGLIALLLGYFGYTAWRKKKLAREESAFDDLPSVSESDLASKSGTVFGAASESVDNGEVSIQGDFSEGGVLTTEESVDPVAEADVLMAYGRDSQAEEILKEGLKTDPTRAAIHLKLLEVYANRKNAKQFEAVAGDLHALSHGQGAEWEKATALAVALGLSGGLFPAAAVTASEPEPVEPGTAPEPIAEQASNETVIMGAAPPAEEAVAVPPAEEDAGSLDFDLDLGTTSGPALAAAAEQAEKKPAADEVMSLDFDFDLGSPEAPVEAVPEVAAELPAADANAIDFSIDVEGSAPVEEAQPVTPVAVAEPEAGEIAFDFDMGSTDEAGADVAAAAEAVAPVPAAGDLSAVGMDFDLDLGSDTPAVEEMKAGAPAPVEPAPAELGLADISLDLGEPDVEASPSAQASVAEIALPEVDFPAPDVTPVAEADLSLDIELPVSSGAAVAAQGAAFVDLPEINLETPASASLEESAEAASVADDPEVATKLELAQAYEEMGDREGARELLTEVLAEGSAAQQAQARSRLDQLDA
jgi:pilus assembly protein FimV